MFGITNDNDEVRGRVRYYTSQSIDICLFSSKTEKIHFWTTFILT